MAIPERAGAGVLMAGQLLRTLMTADANLLRWPNPLKRQDAEE
jgi:hypothetical protein